jgi:hypothetical protein
MTAAILFRILHIVWAILGVIASAILVTSKGGHPPAIILLPVVLIFWVVGHLLLWIISKLFARGKKLEVNIETDTEIKAETDVKKWPLSLIILAVFLGGVFVFGAMAIILHMVLENDRLRKMPVLLALWLPPSLCFIGILLQKSWSRVFVGWWFIALAMIFFYQIAGSAMQGRTNSISEWIIVVAISLFTLFLGQHFLRSPKIKVFYGKENN